MVYLPDPMAFALRPAYTSPLGALLTIGVSQSVTSCMTFSQYTLIILFFAVGCPDPCAFLDVCPFTTDSEEDQSAVNNSAYAM